MMTARLSHVKWDSLQNIQARYNIIYDTGLRIEESVATKFIAKKHREALTALSKSKGEKGYYSTGISQSSKSSICLTSLHNIKFN